MSLLLLLELEAFLYMLLTYKSIKSEEHVYLVGLGQESFRSTTIIRKKK